MVIKLGSFTQLRLNSGLFNNNTINSISILGNYNEGEQLEITSEALRGNNGPYPDINIQNIFTVIIRTKAFSGNNSSDNGSHMNSAYINIYMHVHRMSEMELISIIRRIIFRQL